MHKLFGTDGIRGRAYEAPLDENTVRRLGAALAVELSRDDDQPEILLAGDTRASTPDLAEWLASAFQAGGGRVRWAGVLPTPAVSRLLRDLPCAAGVVISASHNAAHDNGIKILGSGGEKIADASEQRLEQRIDGVEPLSGPGLPNADATMRSRYLDFLLATHGGQRPLDGLHVVVDAANGAASGIAREYLEALGSRVVVIASDPDGSNINDGCGATAPHRLAKRVVAEGADAGLALDGDADRAILVDETGKVLDGDDVLLAWARQLNRSDRLTNGKVVATVMSNFGLERTLREEGMEVIRCPVGDRAVWMTMKANGSALGGEQSGHIICSHYGVSGDGLLTGTHVLQIAAERGVSLSTLSDLQRLPQILLNVPVVEKLPFEEMPLVTRELEGVNRCLEHRGRVLLRYSGTEPLARVMVEGEDAAEIGELAERLAASIRSELG
jgi:phosphoglucosamine mutase